MTSVTVASLRQTLANVIVSELQNKARDADMRLHVYVEKHHANSVGLRAYFGEGCAPEEYHKLKFGDLEVLVDIAVHIGFVIDINWFRRGKK